MKDPAVKAVRRNRGRRADLRISHAAEEPESYRMDRRFQEVVFMTSESNP
jgi:hypothetical protein